MDELPSFGDSNHGSPIKNWWLVWWLMNHDSFFCSWNVNKSGNISQKRLNCDWWFESDSWFVHTLSVWTLVNPRQSCELSTIIQEIFEAGDQLVYSFDDWVGYGFHADFFNGWKAGAVEALLDQCTYHTPVIPRNIRQRMKGRFFKNRLLESCFSSGKQNSAKMWMLGCIISLLRPGSGIFSRWLCESCV